MSAYQIFLKEQLEKWKTESPPDYISQTDIDYIKKNFTCCYSCNQNIMYRNLSILVDDKQYNVIRLLMENINYLHKPQMERLNHNRKYKVELYEDYPCEICDLPLQLIKNRDYEHGFKFAEYEGVYRKFIIKWAINNEHKNETIINWYLDKKYNLYDNKTKLYKKNSKYIFKLQEHGYKLTSNAYYHLLLCNYDNDVIIQFMKDTSINIDGNNDIIKEILYHSHTYGRKNRLEVWNYLITSRLFVPPMTLIHDLIYKIKPDYVKVVIKNMKYANSRWYTEDYNLIQSIEIVLNQTERYNALEKLELLHFFLDHTILLINDGKKNRTKYKYCEKTISQIKAFNLNSEEEKSILEKMKKCFKSKCLP